MKLFSSIAAVLLSLNAAAYEPITATVVFENLTEKTSISGVFYVMETNQQIEINTLDAFKIELPEKGKYEFQFYSEDVYAIVSYPMRITNRKNTVTIRLESKSKLISKSNFLVYYPTKNLSELSTDQMKVHVANGAVNFILHGLVEINIETYQAFKNTYGVGFISKNCVIDPISYKTAVNNNKKVAEYLTFIFGNDWQDQLPAQPFGFQL